MNIGGTLQMKYLIVFVFFFLQLGLCAQISESAVIKTSLEFLNTGKKIDAEITLSFELDSNMPFKIGNLWDYFGAKKLREYIVEVKGIKGTAISFTENRDSLYIVPVSKTASFIYTLRYDSASLSDITYAPNVGTNHVHYFFCQWMLPLVEKNKSLEYEIAVKKFPQGWKLYSSISPNPGNFKVKGSMQQLFSDAIGAGLFEERIYNLYGKKLHVYIAGKFDFSHEKASVLAYETFAQLHLFFKDSSFDFYNIVFLPRDGNIAGISVKNMFVCHLKKDVELQKLGWLMSHEMAHKWVGIKLSITDTATSFELRHQWFKEGINDYLSYMMLFKSRQYKKEDIINTVNSYLKNLNENPYFTASEDSIQKLAAAGGYGVAAIKLPYYKGFMIGFLTDTEFWQKEMPADKSKVVELVLKLYDISKVQKNGQIPFYQLLSITDSMQLPWRNYYMEYILDGSATFDLPVYLFGSSYKLSKSEYAVYDLGFKYSQKDGKYFSTQVDTLSSAYKSGVREGMQIIKSNITNRFSNAWCDCPVKMEVKYNDETKKIVYKPKGKTTEIMQYSKVK
jgi:predicted metalloprotease with PDZ domain